MTTISNIWGSNPTAFFYNITPELILKTIDDLGFKSTGRVFTLNSFENRVYEVEIEFESDNLSEHFKILKFYRPGRWTIDQIQEEHDFLFDLEMAEVPVIAPLKFNGQSIFTLPDEKIYYSLFDKKGGRAPDEFNHEEIEIIGRLIARLHLVGNFKKAQYRLNLNPENFLYSNLNFLLEQKMIPHHLEQSYKKLLETIAQKITPLFKNIHMQRIHGDCHLGNIIKRDGQFHLIDFDDMLIGPSIQDIWLLLPGRDEYAKNQREIILNAYSEMRDFNDEEIRLIEPLRTLRMINYSAWIAKRYDDPAFKQAFPFFETPTYFELQINDLNEQLYYLR